MIKSVNLNMETLVIHPENKEQLAALKALIKSWNINFEKYPYDPNFVAEINKRERRTSNKVILSRLKTPRMYGKVCCNSLKSGSKRITSPL
jgi:hypothetical protein